MLVLVRYLKSQKLVNGFGCGFCKTSERSQPDAIEPIRAIGRADSEGGKPSILSKLSDSNGPLRRVNASANDIAGCQQSAAALPLPCAPASPPHNPMLQVSQPPHPPLLQEPRPLRHLQMSHNLCYQPSAVQSHPIFQVI